MAIDTLIIVLVLVCTEPKPYHAKIEQENRFEECFNEADKQFNKTYKLDIEEIKKSSREAAIEAAIKTKDIFKRKIKQ